MTTVAIGKVVVGVCLWCFTITAGQLPPEVMVDKYLLQATMLSEEKKHKEALEAMDRIVVLQKEHGLTLPKAFPFHYAQIALSAGSVQPAIDAANRYLNAVGEKGKHYQKALELLLQAEQMLRAPAVDRTGTGWAETATEQEQQTPVNSAGWYNENPEVSEDLIDAVAAMDMLDISEKSNSSWGDGDDDSDNIPDEAWEDSDEDQRADAASRHRRVLAAGRRAKQASGQSFLDIAIGAAAAAAIAAAGGGTDKAVEAATVFGDTVTTGRLPVGSSQGGFSSTPTGREGASSDFGDALGNLENSCGERFRSAFSEQDHGRFYCLDAFARHCALKKGHDQQEFDALRHDFEVLRSQGMESRCPYFSVLGGTYNENQTITERPGTVTETKTPAPVINKRTLPTCTDGDTVPIAVAEGKKPGCPPERWCRWNACRNHECRRRYPKCQPGVLQ